MKEMIARLVLRNIIIRKDAAYVIVWTKITTKRQQDEEVFWEVIAYWGPWQRYQEEGEAGLRQQLKYHGHSYSGARTAMYDLQETKLQRGYMMVADDRVFASAEAPVTVEPPTTEIAVEAILEPCKSPNLWGALEL